MTEPFRNHPQNRCPCCGRCKLCGEQRPHDHTEFGGVIYRDAVPFTGTVRFEPPL